MTYSLTLDVQSEFSSPAGERGVFKLTKLAMGTAADPLYCAILSQLLLPGTSETFKLMTPGFGRIRGLGLKSTRPVTAEAFGVGAVSLFTVPDTNFWMSVLSATEVSAPIIESFTVSLAAAPGTPPTVRPAEYPNSEVVLYVIYKKE